MSTKALRRAALAIGVAGALLGLHAGPAAAAGWTIDSGIIHVQKGIVGIDFDIADPEEDPCASPPPPPTIDVDFDDPNTGDVDVTFGSTARTGLFGANYVGTVTGTTVSGSYTAHSPTPPDYDIDLTMDFTVQWRDRGAAPDCTPGDQVCTWDIDGVHFTGDLTGTIPATTGTSVVLDSVSPHGTIASSNCSAGLLDAFDGGTVSVTNLVATFA